MNKFLDRIVKHPMVAKGVERAKHELSKPENQRKIADAWRTIQDKTRRNPGR